MYVHVDNSGAVFIMSNDSVSDRTKHIDIHHRWISSFVPERIYIGHVPTASNYSDIFTKNVATETFVKHAADINEGDIKCYISNLRQQYTKEDVNNSDESWTAVTRKKKKRNNPKKVSWDESVKKPSTNVSQNLKKVCYKKNH